MITLKYNLGPARLLREPTTYGLLITGTFKKQVPELNLWRWPYPYGENFFLTLVSEIIVFMQNQLYKTGLWSWSYFRVTDKILSANEVKEASGVVVVVVYFCIFLWSKPTPPHWKIFPEYWPLCLVPCTPFSGSSGPISIFNTTTPLSCTHTSLLHLVIRAFSDMVHRYKIK